MKKMIFWVLGILIMACSFACSHDAETKKEVKQTISQSQPSSLSEARIVNRKHPEQKDDEIFLTNVQCNFKDTEFEELNDFYQKILYKTKRLGNIAYDGRGKPAEGYRPVFVKKFEFDEWTKRIGRPPHYKMK